MTRSVKITIDIDDMPQDSLDALLRRAVDPETAPVISVADPLTGKAAGEKSVAPPKASMPLNLLNYLLCLTAVDNHEGDVGRLVKQAKDHVVALGLYTDRPDPLVEEYRFTYYGTLDNLTVFLRQDADDILPVWTTAVPLSTPWRTIQQAAEAVARAMNGREVPIVGARAYALRPMGRSLKPEPVRRVYYTVRAKSREDGSWLYLTKLPTGRVCWDTIEPPTSAWTSPDAAWIDFNAQKWVSIDHETAYVTTLTRDDPVISESGVEWTMVVRDLTHGSENLRWLHKHAPGSVTLQGRPPDSRDLPVWDKPIGAREAFHSRGFLTIRGKLVIPFKIVKDHSNAS